MEISEWKRKQLMYLHHCWMLTLRNIECGLIVNTSRHVAEVHIMFLRQQLGIL